MIFSEGTGGFAHRCLFPFAADCFFQYSAQQKLARESVQCGAYATVNPVSIVKYNACGNVLEEIRAVRAGTSGEPSAAEAFARSDYAAWTSYHYTDCCRVSEARVYHDIPASGEGLHWDHYARTSFGYDAAGRRNRTITPGGTVTRVVFAERDEVIETWIGTAYQLRGQQIWTTSFDNVNDSQLAEPKWNRIAAEPAIPNIEVSESMARTPYPKPRSTVGSKCPLC